MIVSNNNQRVGPYIGPRVRWTESTAPFLRRARYVKMQVNEDSLYNLHLNNSC